MATITNIIAEARDLVDATSTSFPDASILRKINQAGEDLVAKLFKLKILKFDDANNTGDPITASNLVDGTQSYALSASYLVLERIEVLDASAKSHKLEFVDEKEINEGLSEYESVDGLPKQYARRANKIYLYPAPATGYVTMTNGLTMYYQRTFYNFTSGDVSTGTKEPGFASPFHYLLSYKAALPYAIKYKKDRVTALMAEILRMEKEMFSFYANVNNDKISKLIPKTENCR